MRIGIYDRYMACRGGGEKRTLALAEAFRSDHEVLVLTESPIRLAEMGDYFGLRLDGVRAMHRDVGSGPLPTRNLRLYRWIRGLGLDLFVNGTYRSELVAPIPNSVYMCMFPDPPARESALERGFRGPLWRSLRRGHFKMDPNPATSYRVITANSRYTARWIRARWNADAVVVYTACDAVSLPPVAKEKLILHVGRFDPLKRQDRLIGAFGGLPGLHEGGWRLVLAGSTVTPAESDPYVRSLRAAGEHLPVTFHFDFPRDALWNLYNRASVYWHASGFGTPQDPGAQEHFGMATFEAATAGAVPVVLNSGGQPEIVTDGITGFLWNSLGELKSLTLELARDTLLLSRMGNAARSIKHRFSKSAYVSSVSRAALG